MSRRKLPLRFENLEARQMLSATTGDFNGDGDADLAVGLPTEVVAGNLNAGIVQVTYGGNGGLDPGNRQNWDLFDILPTTYGAAGAHLGWAVAAGDFNGDGFDDLAIGLPYMSIDTADKVYGHSGAVVIVYGSSAGLTTAGSKFFTQSGLGGYEGTGDLFGFALAAGDFNGDGRDDLAIGTPGQDGLEGGVYGGTAGPPDNSGAVYVVQGSANGLAGPARVWSQGSNGIKGGAEGGDRFGYALAAGDYNGDGRDDLAVGTPGENLGWGPYGNDEGAVNVIYGSNNGLTSKGNQFWNQDSYSVAGSKIIHIADVAEHNDWFGSTLTVGDFDGDGVDDLAVGVSRENVGGYKDAGAVNVIYGKANVGLHAERNRMFDVNDSPLLKDGFNGSGPAWQWNEYGTSLAAGDFDGDGRDDLAVGAPGGFLVPPNNGGLVHVIFSSGNGLNLSREAVLAQGHAGLVNSPEVSDYFGKSLAAGDFDGDGRADLAIEVPGEDYDGNSWDPGAPTAPGAMHIVYAPSWGLILPQNELLYHHANYARTGGVIDPGGRQATSPFNPGSNDPTRRSVDPTYADREVSGEVTPNTSSSPYTMATKSADTIAVDSYFAATGAESTSTSASGLEPMLVDEVFAAQPSDPVKSPLMVSLR